MRTYQRLASDHASPHERDPNKVLDTYGDALAAQIDAGGTAQVKVCSMLAVWLFEARVARFAAKWPNIVQIHTTMHAPEIRICATGVRS